MNDRILRLDLTEQDNETLAWSLDWAMNESAYLAERSSFVYDLTYHVFRKPSRYIEMTASNFLRLCVVLEAVESKLGCRRRQLEAQYVRTKICKMLDSQWGMPADMSPHNIGQIWHPIEGDPLYMVTLRNRGYSVPMYECYFAHRAKSFAVCRSLERATHACEVHKAERNARMGDAGVKEGE